MPTVRLAAVITVAALVLHELRYLIGFGDHAGEALAASGHAYLPFAGGVAGLLIALASAQLLTGARARAQDRPRGTGSELRAPGLAIAAALLVVYSGQELIEAALSPGRHLGPAVPFAEGGWSAFPLALRSRRGRRTRSSAEPAAPSRSWPRVPRVAVHASAEAVPRGPR